MTVEKKVRIHAISAIRFLSIYISEGPFKENQKHLDENGKKVYETEVTTDVLSLQGYTGTPGYLAFQEWNAYEQAHTEPKNQETVPMED